MRPTVFHSSEQTIYNEGQRHVVLYILDKIGFAKDPEKFMALIEQEQENPDEVVV